MNVCLAVCWERGEENLTKHCRLDNGLQLTLRIDLVVSG